MEFKDYYAVLGVKPETPTDEIKRAYRKLARQYHPDVSKLPDAESKFKEINEAWEVLQDKEKRTQYDQMRTGGWQQQQHAHGANQRHRQYAQGFSEQSADFSEFFRSMFGEHEVDDEFAQAPHRGRHFRGKGKDYHVKVTVPLTVAYQGGVQNIQLQIPTLTPDGHEDLQNKTLKIKIPAGVVQGSQIRLKEQGGPGIGGAPHGDLYVEIAIEPHPYFSLNQKDIYLNLPITPWEAALGASLAVPTLGGNVNLKIPVNSQSGQKMRLKGRGMKGETPGDQYVILQIQAPKATTEKEKTIYEEMAKAMPFNPREGLGV
jgi:curved DNA-binding protein